MIQIKLDGIPPSLNHAYANARGRGRVLTPQGISYKNTARLKMLTQLLKQQNTLQKNEAINVCFVFFTQILNQNGGKQIPERKVKGTDKETGLPTTRIVPAHTAPKYKKLDTTNRVKLVEDVLVDVLGIDDSQFTQVLLIKKESSVDKTHIFLWNETETPFQKITEVLELS